MSSPFRDDAAQEARLDGARPFQPLRVAVLTVSDTRTPHEDRSGDLLAARAAAAGHPVVARRLVPDDQPALEEALRALAAAADVVLATGGTGITGRDVTPEALAAVASKEIPGFGELFRWQSFGAIGTATIQSRAAAAVVDGALVFALPGSPGACADAWDGILRFQLDSRLRPCSFATLLPRLRER